MQILRQLRKDMKRTQQQMADFLGITQQAYAAYENDKSSPPKDVLQKLADFFNVSVDYILNRDSNRTSKTKGKWVNVYGKIAAGIPIEAIEEIIDQEEISADMATHGEYIALKVQGSSMEPRIVNGDVVIIRLQETIENGEIAAVFVNGNDVTLKQVKKEDDGLWLLPLNPAFQPLFYSKKECAELPVRILGKMVELRAKF